jgi:Ca-activated chloride channel homolog
MECKTVSTGGWPWWIAVAGAGLLFWLCSISTLAQEPTVPQPAIRVNVERVDVGVIVTDLRGKFVEGLRRDDFHVFDNGAEQPITEFVAVEEPAQVLLLVEAGPAVYFLQDAHLFVADALLSGLSAGDQVAVARYTEAPAALLDFSPDKSSAQAALDRIRFNLGFGQLNLSTSLLGILDWLARVPGKKTIVLISTGVDTSAPSVIEALQSRLQVGDVRILAVSMSGPLRNGKEGSKRTVQQAQQGLESADARLRAISEATGGRAFFPEDAKAFRETYRQVAQLVRHEYSLAFAPPNADGAVHSIDVKVDSTKESGKETSAYRVDHRNAYVAPKPLTKPPG